MSYHPLDDPTGGSLSTIAFLDHEVHKSYCGPLTRGYDKLRKEYEWLQGALESLGSLVPRALALEETPRPRSILLRLERLQKVAVAKAMLSGLLTPGQVGAVVDTLFDSLTTSVYPIHTAHWTGSQIYDTCQRERINLARRYLQEIPYVWAFWTATSVTVNGIVCPTVSEFLGWLASNRSAIYRDSRVWAFHGNLHLDNVLVGVPFDTNGVPDIAVIDPRGDLLGPVHSDLAKLLITLEAGYDLIHYNRYSIELESELDNYNVTLRLSPELNVHYAEARSRALAWTPHLAEMEGVAEDVFLHAVHVTMCVHVLSFCFYHAYRADAVPSRVRSYLATFALLARRAMRAPGHPVAETADALSALWE